MVLKGIVFLSLFVFLFSVKMCLIRVPIPKYIDNKVKQFFLRLISAIANVKAYIFGLSMLIIILNHKTIYEKHFNSSIIIYPTC